jgi:phospholipase C
MMNRRQAVRALGGLAGMATMSKFLSGCGGDGDRPVGITNYVYLMLENRTYDHVFGARKLVEGLAGDGLTATMSNKDASGTVIAPYPAKANELCVLDPPHGWDASHAQFNSGMNDGFVTEYQRDHNNMPITDVMAYLTRDLAPVSYALADNYTTCDRWFASVMGPTLPNRAYWHTATSFGLQVNNEVLSKFSSVPVPTIYNRLEDKGVTWAYYSGPLSVVSLLGSPGPFQLDVTGRVKRFSAFADMPDDPNGDFFADCLAGRLPAVTYIDPFFGENDDHPPGHPILTQALIAAIYRALAMSPQWENCMLVITYDEHGGFFDHVPPPTTTDDSFEKFGVPGFEQCGFRVPAIVAGPYVKQNYVSSVQYDHTSALKHLQNAFDLETLTPRMDAASDLTDCIDMERLARGEPAPPVEIPTINLADYPMTLDPVCRGSAFRTKDPITEWADANPGSALDRRAEWDRDRYHRGIVEFLRKTQG